MESEVIIKDEGPEGVKIRRFDSRGGDLRDTMLQAKGAIERRTPAADIPVKPEPAQAKTVEAKAKNGSKPVKHKSPKRTVKAKKR